MAHRKGKVSGIGPVSSGRTYSRNLNRYNRSKNNNMKVTGVGPIADGAQYARNIEAARKKSSAAAAAAAKAKAEAEAKAKAEAKAAEEKRVRMFDPNRLSDTFSSDFSLGNSGQSFLAGGYNQPGRAGSWFDKGLNKRVPNEANASFGRLFNDDWSQLGKFTNKQGKVEGGLFNTGIPKNFNQVKQLFSGKGGLGFSFGSGIDTGPTPLGRQFARRFLPYAGQISLGKDIFNQGATDSATTNLMNSINTGVTNLTGGRLTANNPETDIGARAGRFFTSLPGRVVNAFTGGDETQVASTLRATSIAAKSINRRLSSLNFGKQARFNQGIQLAFNGSNEDISKLFNYTLNKLNMERDIDADWNAWTTGSITIGQSDRTSSKSGVDFEIQNIGIGIDKQFSPSYLYGFSMHHSATDDEIDGINNVDTQTISISSYHNLDFTNNQNINAAFIYSESDIKTMRRGTDNVTYYYGYRDGYSLQISFGYSLYYDLGNVSIAPKGEVDYGLIKLERFSESAGIDSLTFDDQHIHNSALSLGAEFSYNQSFDKGQYSFIPFGEVSVEENLTDTSNLYAIYSAGTSQLFTKAMKRDYDNSLSIILGSNISYQEEDIGRFSIQRVDQIDHGEEYTIQLDIKVPF